MRERNSILVFEYGSLIVGQEYDGVLFKQQHLDLLQKYLTANSKCGYFLVFFHKVVFQNYVGVIKVANLTIEVLPKTDKHEEDKKLWQNVLLKMLWLSIQIEAETTTVADINLHHHSVLETYLHFFLNEVDALMREGLAKKYRSEEANQNSLRGKLLIHRQISINLTRAERFYTAYQTYDFNNRFNSIIQQALEIILHLNVSDSLKLRSETLLLHFPATSTVTIQEKLFSTLKFDRKTERYRLPIQYAQIILMHYHPDVKSGSKNVLAIMFDMNYLWETFIYVVLRKAASKEKNISVHPQKVKLFWQKQDESILRLKPDIVLTTQKGKNIILDTKWKFQKNPSVEDVRQMFAYNVYFSATQGYLMYPDKLSPESRVIKKEGHFYQPNLSKDVKEERKLAKESCGLIYIDPITEKGLNINVGEEILRCCLAD